MKEAVARGFNCVRLDDGAGLWCDPAGKARGPVAIRPPFGAFSARIRQMDVLATPRTCDVRARLLEAFRAADRQGVIPRTTSGPEDPCWTLRADDLRTVNRLFRAP